MPKQSFDLIDLVAPLIVGLIFAVCLFISSVVINFTFITKYDDVTSFEKLGARFNVRAGPHALEIVKKTKEGGFIQD